MDSNNKFGTCCKCPALMQDGRIYTSYAPRRDYNASLMKELKVNNSNDYRSIMQENGQSIIDSVQKNLENSYKCVNVNNNLFYRDNDIHKYFNDQLKVELSKPSEL